MEPTTCFGITTAIVVILIVLLDHLFSLLKIIFKRPIKPTQAVEIDPKEHIYAHPKSKDGLMDPKVFDVHTIYEIMTNSVKLYGNRRQLSYRSSSDQPFQSYTFKYV